MGITFTIRAAMEFDWNNPPFNLDSSLTLQEIEESFEDPFAIRLLPDSPRFSVQARFFNLGMSAGGIGHLQRLSDEREAGSRALCPPVRAGRAVLLPAEAGSDAGPVNESNGLAWLHGYMRTDWRRRPDATM